MSSDKIPTTQSGSGNVNGPKLVMVTPTAQAIEQAKSDLKRGLDQPDVLDEALERDAKRKKLFASRRARRGPKKKPAKRKTARSKTRKPPKRKPAKRKPTKKRPTKRKPSKRRPTKKKTVQKKKKSTNGKTKSVRRRKK